MPSSAAMLDLIQKKKKKENHPKAYSYSDIWKQFQVIYRSFLQIAQFLIAARQKVLTLLFAITLLHAL